MTEEELARHDSKTLLQLLLSADARCDALTAERDRAEDELYELQQTCITLRGENEALTAERDEAWAYMSAAQGDLYDAVMIEAERDRLREALEQFLIEYDEVDLADAEPSSLTAAVLEARAALKGESHE